jgi:exopolysaccharide biosynthesis polyprenyl glycosylphosphotransferase
VSDMTTQTSGSTPAADQVEAERHSNPEASGRRTAASVRRGIVAVLIACDALMVTLAGIVATLARFDTLGAVVVLNNGPTHVQFVWLSVALLPLWIALFAYEGLYDLDRLEWNAGELNRVVRAVSMSLFLVILGTYLLKLQDLSRGWLVLLAVFATVFTIAGRLTGRAFIGAMRRSGRLSERTVVVGTNEEAAQLVSRLRKDGGTGIEPVGFATGRDDMLGKTFLELPCLGPISDIRKIVLDQDIDTVLVASTSLPHDDFVQLFDEIRGLPVQLHVSSGLYRILTSRVLVREIAGVPLITVKAVPLSRAKLLEKRGFDLTMGVLAAIVLSPIWIPVAVLIKLTSRGPALYRQIRVGRDGKPFEMLKFRSMVSDADEKIGEIADLNEADGLLFKVKNDPRFTALGRFIRKFSIDELPQVINVMRGEMSLVGPRPPLPREVENYEQWHHRRLEVTPGMTGLWQVSGRSDLSFDEMVRLDIFYIENWSPRFDVGLILRTIPVVLFGRGAY